MIPKKPIILLLSLLFATQASADMIVALTRNLGTTGGGEFSANVVSSPIGIFTTGESFGTFCVETDEYVTLSGREYNVVLNTVAIGGGANADDFDPLDPMSAWIYTQWMTQSEIHVNNALGDFYIYHDDAGANLVQRALWDIEEEGDYSSFTGVDALIEEARLAGWTDIGNVRVMNLYTPSGLYAQDQLTLVPVPATILLGLLGLGVGSWKVRKSI